MIADAQVEIGPLQDRIQAIGTERAGRSVTVTAPVAGTIGTIDFTSTTLVERGTVPVETAWSGTGDIRSIEVAGFDFPTKDIAKCNVPIICGGQFHCDESELVKDIDHVDFHTIDLVG